VDPVARASCFSQAEGNLRARSFVLAPAIHASSKLVVWMSRDLSLGNPFNVIGPLFGAAVTGSDVIFLSATTV
jgi:anthranilate phosphoribosyltransferase